MKTKQSMNLKMLEKLFGEWDDGYYDPMPRAFRRFSKGLYNLMSFTVRTIEAYDFAKSQASENSTKPTIFKEYFVPRLFELGYLAAWAAFETYLREVAWLKLSEKSKPLASEIILKTQRITDIVCLYKRLIGIDLKKVPTARALLRDKKKRNKLAHSGKALGYTSHLETDEYWLNHTAYAATKDDGAITEEFFCQTLAWMWKFGDHLRKKLFEVHYPKKQ